MSDLNITLSVALNAVALTNAADELTRLAGFLDGGESSDDIKITHDASASNTGPASDDTTTGGTVKTTVELDSLGLPWDERINTDSRAVLKKQGTWKVKRNTPPELVEFVRAELKAAMAATGESLQDAIDTDPRQRMTDGTAPPPPGGTAPPPPGGTAPPPPAVETITKYITPEGGEYTYEELIAAGWNDTQIRERETVEIEVEPETSNGITFPELMGKITPALNAGTITNDQIDAALASYKVPTLVLLPARPDVVPLIDAALFPAG